MAARSTMTCLTCRHGLRSRQLMQEAPSLVGVAPGHPRRRQHTSADRHASQESGSSNSNSMASGNSRSSSSGSHSGPQSTAAAHILAQARIEEADLSPTSSISTRAFENQRKEVPWTGDESIEDAVLRMLVDKYKPLRVPGTKRKIQQPSSEPLIVATYKPVTPPESEEDLANRITDQSHPDYKWRPGDPPRFPWEHTFRGPESTGNGPLIKSGVITKSPSIPSSKIPKGEVAARVFRARDASVDYRSGSTDTAKAKVASGGKGKGLAYNRNRSASDAYKPTPNSIKAWNTVVEERIELARQQGIFRNLKGHGKPMERDINESNPYVDRSEFLMNRIVKRQEAAPPFVELQQEMRDDQNAFRLRLRQAWTRRAIRMLSLQPLTPSVIESSGDYRDPEWEERERGYHEKSVANLNSLIRKYNVVAPPSARAPVTSVEAELKGCFRECAALIKMELEKRAKEGPGAARLLSAKGGPKSGPKGRTEEEQDAVKETMLSAFRRFVKDTFGSK